MAVQKSKGFTVSLGSPTDAADWVAHLNEVAGETKFCSFDKNG